MVITGLTGSALVFRDEIDLALNGELLRATAPGKTAPLQEIVRTVEAAFPDARIFSLRVPRNDEEVYEVRLESNAGRRVYVDPHKAMITGDREPFQKFIDLVFYVHSELLGGEPGKTLVGGLAISLLALITTGLVLWWPNWRLQSAGVAIRRQRGTRVIMYDLHKAVGVSALVFLGVTAFTGLSLVFHPSFERALNWITGTPERPAAPKSTDRSLGGRVPLDDLIGIADRAVPAAKTTWVMFPQTPDGTFRVRKKLPEELHPNGKTFVMLDQYSGRVLQVEHALAAPFARRFDNGLYPVHIGRWGGLTSRLLQVLVGLTPLLLFATGWTMWRKRSANRKTSLPKRKEGPKPIGFR